MKSISRVRDACALLILFALTATGVAQEERDEPFNRLADRYWQILHERPRQGTAFERWYQHYHDAGRGAELLEMLETRARTDPDFATHMLLGFVYERQRQLEDARAAYEAAEQIDNQQHIAPASLGLLHVQERRFSQAADCLSRALERGPPAAESLTLYQHLGRAWLRLGRRQQALLTFHDIVKAFPEDAGVLRQVAVLLTDEGQFADAISHWELIAALPDEDPYLRVEARTKIAALRIRLRQRAEAIEVLDGTLEDVLPESWVARSIWEQIEQAFLDAEDADGFQEYCRHRLERQPDDLDARLHLAHATSLAGDRDQSIREFERAVELAPTRRDIREQLIHQLVLSGRIQRALQQCEVIVTTNPDDPDALVRLGELQLRQRRASLRVVEEAVNTWKKIAELKPDDPFLALNVAELCRRTVPTFAASESTAAADHRVTLLRDTAEEFYREAVHRAPENSQYREYLGEFLHAQDRREEAVEAWSQIASGPDATATDWRRLAEVFGAFNYLDEAVAALTNAISQRPAEFEWHMQRIQWLLDQEAYDQVDSHLPDLIDAAATAAQRHRVRQVRVAFYRHSEQIVRQINLLRATRGVGTPTTDDLWTLALLYTEQRQSAGARSTFNTLLAREPDNVQLLRDYLRFQQNSRNLEDAVKLLRRIVELDPQHRLQDYEQIVMLELQREQPAAAREMVTQMIQLAPERPQTYVLQARVEFTADAVEEGLSALRRAVQLAPQDVGLRDHLARSLSRHERTGEALDQFWRCFELADDPGEQRSLVAAMCSAAQDVPQREQIALRLRRLRSQREDPHPLTLCLIEALRSSENYDSARHELEQMLQERPNDLSILHELTALSVTEEAWNQAAGYQQRVVELTDSPDDRQRLLTYSERAGRNEEAAQIAASLLPFDDPAACIEDIRRKLYADRCQDAVNIAEIGLTLIPDNWQLQLHAASAYLLLGDDTSAGRYFEAAAESSARISASFVDSLPAYHDDNASRELETARSTYSNLMQVLAARDDSNRADEQKYPGLTLLPHFPDASREGYVAAVIGAYVVARESGRSHDWIQGRHDSGEEHPDQWRHLIWVYAATATLNENHQFVAAYIGGFPLDPLPHLARLSQDYSEPPAQFLSIAERSAEREALRSTYHWLVLNRPALQADFVYSYGSEMLRMGDTDEAVSAFIDSLQHESADIRRQAAVSLRSAGTAALRSLPALIERLADDSVDVALEAAATLGTFGPVADSAIPDLIETLGRDSLPLRQEAAYGLSRMGDKSLEPLLAAMRNEDARMRHGATLALYYLGLLAEPAIPALTHALNDSSPDVRDRAQMTLDSLRRSSDAPVPD